MSTEKPERVTDSRSARALCRAALLACLGVVFCLAGATRTLADSGRGRHRQLYVVPAPGEVVIDGDLDDWDLSGRIEVFVREATRGSRNVRFAMMYDAEALYISGKVRDPNPMMNRHDPLVMPHRAWDADACQVRIVVNADSEYPVEESTFRYRGRQHEDTRDDIIHLLLWHYTDEGTAHLQMHQGMGYRAPTGWEPHGLVPRDKFEAAFRKWDDGGGYTFEYRIPWTTLRTDNPPRAGSTVAGTMQMHWSRPDGLALGGGSNVARDILDRPGVPFQQTVSWGRMIFTDSGNVPQDLVIQGVPRERPRPLSFPYTLPDDVETTIQIEGTDRIVHRVLIAQETRPGGENTELWDGMDNHFMVPDHGDFLAAGEYRWRGVYNTGNLRAEYRFSVHNSGVPPYRTADGTGGWGGDHGQPRDVVALDDGLLFSWEASEAGFGLIRTDLEGRKKWGSNQDARYASADADSIYIAGGRGFVRHEGVRRLHLVDARPRTFANGGDLLHPPAEARGARITGVLVSGGMLYVSYGTAGLIAVYDVSDASLAQMIEIAQPGRMAALSDGRIVTISDGRIVILDGGAPVMEWTEGVDEPQGVAICEADRIYVTNQGALQQVTVFDPDGTLLGRIGRTGGRPAMGAYDPSGMYMGEGIAIAADGRLWVAEAIDYPKRISRWDVETGENIAEFFGASSYFAYGFIDPDRPDEIYAHNVLWAIDWENYTTRPLTTIWRRTEPDMAPHPEVTAYGGVFRMITADNGRQFGWGGAPHQAVMVYMRDGDRFRPMLGDFAPWRGPRFDHGIPAVDEKKVVIEAELGRIRGNTQYLFWQDQSGDGRVRPGEFTVRRDNLESLGTLIQIDKQMALWFSCGRRLKPRETDADGRPYYDLSDVEGTPLTGRLTVGEGGRSWSIVDPDGAAYTMSVTSRGNSTSGFSRWNPEGRIDWRFPDLLRWRDGRTLAGAGPGRFWGSTQVMGVGGDFLATQTYFGATHIFRTDGMYVGAVLGGGPSGRYDPALTDTRYDGQSEGQGGTFVKLNLNGEDRFFLMQGSHDVRVWEILGLDTLADLDGGAYIHREEDEQSARSAHEAFIAATTGAETIQIVRGREALAEAPSITRRIEGERGFTVRVAYDDDNLYLAYEVEGPHRLRNAVTDRDIVFRGGNLIDLQIATDPDADPERTTPAVGDIRLLVSRHQNRPFGILFRSRVAGFEGERTVLRSPTGEEPFDAIDEIAVGIDYTEERGRFEALVTVPLKSLGLVLKPGMELRMDLGYIFGDSQGRSASRRVYLNNNSFSANIVDDIPNESRLEPAEWGTAVVTE